ncbi:carbamoyltransferase [Micromonospora sp. KC606]|uniref:carbamoyltransferase family protein n=1 Tax=Micromonospora sp. KC606 TaxID=2530379 RepID=UPI0010433222|nr:carbamoyltransferase C-terminal domain-containing protein [Micromonospora sp. KC606]TDC85520.1 carbamoyltransferase [Micromonospora sp. KC606]
MSNVLGVSALYHDAAAAIMVDGRLIAAAQEERFSRRKQDRTVPWRAARACLDLAGLTMAEIDCLAYYEDPAMKLDRQMSMLATETRPQVARELAARIDPYRPFRALRESLGCDRPIRFVPHHMSHAASAFYFSGFESAAVLVLDGVGEWSTSSYGFGHVDRGIDLVEADRFPHSLGLFYSTITAYLGFDVNEGEYKTMGLAPLGKPVLADRLRHIIGWNEDGDVRLDLTYFDFLGLRRMWSPRLVELLGQPPRAGEEALTDWHADLASSAQSILESVVLQKASRVRERTGARNLCMAGGVALNCVANARLRQSGLFDDIFVQPAAGDAGGSLGAAAQVSRDLGSAPPVRRLRDVYLGPEYSTERDVIPVVRAANLPFGDFRIRPDELLDDVVRRLAAGQVVGWFQGRMEFGPRALGNRSILADPRVAGMRDRINGLVKLREAFRPFAPSVLRSHASTYFAGGEEHPFMLETVQALTDSLPAVTHADGSARVQTVDPQTNPRYAALLERFWSQEGCAVLLNTSFNQRGEPIVCTPTDALACFARSRLDAVVLGDVLVDVADVPPSLTASITARGKVSAFSDEPESGRALAVYELA